MYEYFVGASAVSPILLVAWKQFKDKKHFSETVEKLKNLPSLLEKEKQTTEKLLGSIADSEEKVKLIQEELFDAMKESFTDERIKQFLLKNPSMLKEQVLLDVLNKTEFSEELKAKLQKKLDQDDLGHVWVESQIKMLFSFTEGSRNFDQQLLGKLYLCKKCSLKKKFFDWPKLNMDQKLKSESWNQIHNTNGWYDSKNSKIEPRFCDADK